MMFFEDFICQRIKKAHLVCGDYSICERTEAGMLYILCDGIGSGVYANISAITCASRILHQFLDGVPIRLAGEKAAVSMHRARKEDVPFSSFSAVNILPSGKFTVYSYESPIPIVIKDNHATVLSPRYYTAEYEVIAEVSGSLGIGDSLLVFTDGVSQSGMGRGFGLGIGSDGVRDFINRNLKQDDDINLLPSRVMGMCKKISGGFYEDDTTIALIHTREAKELTLLTGPPSKQSMDKNYVADFMQMPGKKVICGSTTIEILSRELGLDARVLSLGTSFGEPPEYQIDGVDMATEGAVTLNQVYNILDEPEAHLDESSVVERLCLMLKRADVIHMMIGNSQNTAHQDLIFKQVGVRVRKATVQQIAEKLSAEGKLIIKRYY